MRNTHPTMALIALFCTLVAGSLTAAYAGPRVAAAANLTRAVRFHAVSASKFRVARVGRWVNGKVSFASSLGGNPTGSATQACGRVTVYASKYVPPASGDLFGHQEIVKQVKATPVDAGDLAKGCKYSMAGLPANQPLAIDANYTPTTAWNPVCSGNIAQISTNEVMTLTLPNAPVQVTLDLALDYKYCGNLN